MKVVPQVFYKHPKIEKVLVDGLSSVILKSVQQTDSQNERYLASHALTLVLNGSLQVEDDLGTVTVVPKNHFVFLPKGLYAITDLIPKNESFDAIVFFFDEELTSEFLIHFDDPKLPKKTGNLKIPYTEHLRLFVDSLIGIYRGTQQHQFTQQKLLELLHLVALTHQGDSFISQLYAVKNRARKSIKLFMEENFSKPLDIEDYAYLTGRSISTFRRDFTSRYGISPKKWLIEQRLEKASELLQKTSESITEIALQSGYENIPHFIKAFQKKFETSPKQYQIQHRSSLEI
jgi:AraC-like DNA-binding protein